MEAVHILDLNNFVEYLESLKLYRQSRVNRWQLRDYVFVENDSEHQLYTSQIIVIINKLFNVPDDIALKALSYGCCHDYVESTEDSFGDVNHMLKANNPTLKKLVEEQERSSIKKVDAFYEALVSCEQNDTAMLIVKVADTIEALLYDRRELKFNTVKAEWKQIEQEIMERLVIYWNKLTEVAQTDWC